MTVLDMGESLELRAVRLRLWAALDCAPLSFPAPTGGSGQRQRAPRKVSGPPLRFGLWLTRRRMYFLVYEYLVQSHCARNNCSREDISPLWALTYGATAGYGLWGSIYPVDVVKSKIQTDSLDPSKQKYRGMLDCARQTWRAQGVKGFTGGLTPTLVRSPFANGATFVAFELAMRAMGSPEKGAPEHELPDPIY